MKRLVILGILIVALAGCSTKFSTIEPEGGGQRTAYIATQQELMDDTEIMMRRTFPGRDLTRVDGDKVFGFTTWTRFMLDTYTQQAMFFLVKGADATGAGVDAYALEVSGEGSSGSGRNKNIQLWKDLKAFLDKKYPLATVK